MNIFEKRIAERIGVPHTKDFYGINMHLESVEIKSGIPIFNYTASMPDQIKKMKIDFKLDFSKDD